MAETLLVTRKNDSSMKQADLRDIFKKSQECWYINLTPCLLVYQLLQLLRLQKEREVNPDHPEPADEGDIQMEYPQKQ